MNSGLFVLVSLLLLLPLALPGNPPLLDYHNHLARLSIAFEPDPLKSSYYDFAWTPVGNLGIEAVVAVLAKVVSVETAAQMAVALAIIVNCAGLGLLSKVMHGRITVPALLGLCFVWGGTLQYGFLSFTLGSGLALLATAQWIATEKRPLYLRLLLGSVACLILYFTHSLAFLTYGLIIFGYMFGRLFWAKSTPPWRRMGDALIAGLQAIPTIVVVALTGSGGSVTAVTYLSIKEKAQSLALLFFEPVGPAAVGILLVFAGLLALSVYRHRWPFPPHAVGPVAVLALAYILFPDEIIRTTDTAANLDWRFLLPLSLFASAALRDPFQRSSSPLVPLLSAGLVVMMLGLMVMRYWIPWIPQERELRACLQEIEPGARVAAFFQPWDARMYLGISQPPGLMHIAAWAVTDRSAFYPALFAFSGQQPLGYIAHPQLRRDGKHMPFLQEDMRFLVSDYDWVIVIYPDTENRISENLRQLISPAACSGATFSLHPVGQSTP